MQSFDSILVVKMKPASITISIFVFVFVFTIANVKCDEGTTETVEEAPEEEGGEIIVSSDCDYYEGHYAKTTGWTCCQNETLENVINEDDEELLRQCITQLNKTDTDDMPTAMWREFLCMIKSGGGNDNTIKTFKAYMEFMTTNYTEPYKSDILKNVAKCDDSENEKDEAKRLEMFQKCLYRTERKVCHNPRTTNISAIAPEFETTKDYCKPVEDFPYFGARCCKGRPIPLAIKISGFDAMPSNDAITNCSHSFVERQMELDPKIKEAENMTVHRINYESQLAHRCFHACEKRGTNYTTTEDLIIDLEKIKSKLYTIFSKSTRNDLLTLFTKYTKENNFMMPDNSTVSVVKAVELMASMEEVKKIGLYCDLHNFILLQIEVAAVEDYCFDEKFAQRYVKTHPIENPVNDVPIST